MRDKTTAKEDRTDGVNANVPWRIVDVRVLPGYAIAVRFADGTEGEVDLSRLVLGPNAGVFAALRDRAVFVAGVDALLAPARLTLPYGQSARED